MPTSRYSPKRCQPRSATQTFRKFKLSNRHGSAYNRTLSFLEITSMRRAVCTTLALFAVTPALAQDCAKEVQAAFEKQRLSPAYRVLSKQPSPRGEIQTTTEFLRPDRMYNKVIVPGEPAALETIAIGRWAWASHGGGFQELQPQFAQSVTFDVSATLNTPIATAEPFTCLGKQTRDGKELLGYQSEPKASPGKPVGPDNPLIARKVFIDPATGLPVLNVVAEAKADAPALVSAAYSYPTDLKIEAPDAVPAGRTR
jgi:hypothetical protein